VQTPQSHIDTVVETLRLADASGTKRVHKGTVVLFFREKFGDDSMSWTKEVLEKFASERDEHIDYEKFLDWIFTRSPGDDAEVPQPAVAEKVVDSPVIAYVEVPRLVIAEAAEKTVEVLETQTVAGATSSENLSSAPACQTAPAEAVQVVEVGRPLPAESAPAVCPQTPTGLENYTISSIVDGGESAGSLAGVDAPAIVPWEFCVGDCRAKWMLLRRHQLI